jgi:hypothetical protein
MEKIEKVLRTNKGGRPKAVVKRKEHIAVMCTIIERKVIEVNARRAGLTLSEFLRELGVKGRVNQKIKTLPKEVLQLKATLNHLAANLNQIARKRNKGEDLNALDRALLNQEVRSLQTLSHTIQKYLS